MVNSILDTDLYKFTMQQAIHALYPRAEVNYKFINRGRTTFPLGFAGSLQSQVDHLSRLRLTDDEAQYLSTACPFLTPVYIDFLKSYKFDPEECTITQQGEDLKVLIRGPWYRTVLWEVPLMSMISELYFDDPSRCSNSLREELLELNATKAKTLQEHGVKFADFGTRRRYSSENHDLVVGDLLHSVGRNTLVGTSNMHFAQKYGIKPIGTHAHEWFMFHATTNGYRLANKAAMDAWTQVYQGDLGIALTDTYTTEMFLTAFDSVHARLFDGVRHDSGDPYTFADRIVEHYEKLRIDPLSKTIVFSDGVTTDKAVKIQQHCSGKIKTSFGIGTHLSNDVGATPLNMVIKMSHCRERSDMEWYPTVKLSDDEGKHTGEADEVRICKNVIERSLPRS